RLCWKYWRPTPSPSFARSCRTGGADGGRGHHTVAEAPRLVGGIVPHFAFFILPFELGETRPVCVGNIGDPPRLRAKLGDTPPEEGMGENNSLESYGGRGVDMRPQH